MVCPYRVVMTLLTIVAAALVGWSAVGDQDNVKKGDGNGRNGEEEGAPKKKKTPLQRSAYGLLIVLLIIFHLEMFTNGYLCRRLFGGAASASVAGSASATATPVA
eukprot:m.53562 g.53562  ORF g.53562 m.53562 type:complete len:105 (+) comp13177_c0_seq1:234-548(+)